MQTRITTARRLGWAIPIIAGLCVIATSHVALAQAKGGSAPGGPADAGTVISAPGAPVAAGAPVVAGAPVIGPAPAALPRQWGLYGWSPKYWGFNSAWGAYTYPYYFTGLNGPTYSQEAAFVAQARGVDARAELTYAEAQRAFIDNERAWLLFRYERHDLYQARKAAETEKERIATQHWLATRQPQKPARLTTAQLEGYTGVIRWPAALMRPEFLDQRTRLEALFAARAQTGSSFENAESIRIAARSLQEDLRDRIDDYTTNPNEYLAARHFLESLALEGEYPVES